MKVDHYTSCQLHFGPEYKEIDLMKYIEYSQACVCKYDIPNINNQFDKNEDQTKNIKYDYVFHPIDDSLEALVNFKNVKKFHDYYNEFNYSGKMKYYQKALTKQRHAKIFCNKVEEEIKETEKDLENFVSCEKNS